MTDVATELEVTVTDDTVTQASHAAKRAAELARVEVAVVASQPEARAVVDVVAQVWPNQGGSPPIHPEMSWALAFAGNYVALAQRDGVAVGAAVAFRGTDDLGAHLHSHMAGVLPGLEGASIGFAIKQHQRAWALEQGLNRVTWTFDPLVARNAYFNIMKLGAEVVRYDADFYGPLSDDVNAGDQTDRCFVSWRLTSPRAVAAAIGEVRSFDADAIRASGAVVALDARDDGGPITHTISGSTVLCRLPDDIVRMRATAPALADEWRLALRGVLDPALNDGFEVIGLSRDSWLILARR